MEITQFAQKIQKAVSQALGEAYDVRLEKVEKNNGVFLESLVILTRGRNVSPTIYLEPFWQAYEQGMTLAELVREMLQIYREGTPREKVDLSFFTDFHRVRDRICYRLIHGERNRSLLERIPHIPFLDLAICFYYAYEDKILGRGSILIQNTHMETWKTTTAELMGLAQRNTPRLFAWECLSMAQLMGDENTQWEPPIQVVSNRQRNHGAACILYPGVLGQLAEEFRSDFYVIPSSVHEMILLPRRGCEDAKQLREIIAEVNRLHVQPEEILSDNLYYFNRKTGDIKIFI